MQILFILLLILKNLCLINSVNMYFYLGGIKGGILIILKHMCIVTNWNLMNLFISVTPAPAPLLRVGLTRRSCIALAMLKSF